MLSVLTFFPSGFFFMGRSSLLLILVICIWHQCVEVGPRCAKNNLPSVDVLISLCCFSFILLPSIALKVNDVLLMTGHKNDSCF